MDFDDIEKTTHYKRQHEHDVPWDVVVHAIFTTKRKKIGEYLYSFTSEHYYILAKLDGRTLKVINAKRRKK